MPVELQSVPLQVAGSIPARSTIPLEWVQGL